MDAKSAARSQRAQSQRANSKHTSKHRFHKQNEPPNKKSNDKDRVAAKPESHKPSVKALPSNWDRYEEDVVFSGPEADQSFSNHEETPPIKSKGADYSYLLSQAHEQAGFDAQMPDYAEGVNSMLYVRGHNILSWGEDDTFIVKDDNIAADNEASYFSLDLHGIASQLAHLERSKRLFIEEDKLPADLFSNKSKVERHKHGEEQQQLHSGQNESRAHSEAGNHPLEEEQECVVFDQNESRVFAQSAKHQVGEEKEQAYLNKKELILSRAESDRESHVQPDLQATHKSTEIANFELYSGESILREEELTFSGTNDQGHSHREAANFLLPSSLESQRKVVAPQSKVDSIMKVDNANVVDAMKPHISSLKIQEAKKVLTHNVKAGTVQFEAATAEAELDALLDALDEPSNIGTSKLQGTITDRISSEKSIDKGKQPLKDQFQGPSSFLSRHKNNVEDLYGKKTRGHEEDTKKIKYGSGSIAATTVLPPKSSTSLHKDDPKVLEDDFDKWLDTF